LLFFTGLALFAVGYVLFGHGTVRAADLPRWGGLLIAIGAMLYVVGAFSLPVFGAKSPMVTIVEMSGAIPFGLGFNSLGYTLWRGSEAFSARCWSRHNKRDCSSKVRNIRSTGKGVFYAMT
jgi:hypothetical protein